MFKTTLCCLVFWYSVSIAQTVKLQLVRCGMNSSSRLEQKPVRLLRRIKEVIFWRSFAEAPRGCEPCRNWLVFNGT